MKRIEEDIKNGLFHPVYLLYGEETYLVHKYRDSLRKAVVADGDEMNFSYFQGDGIDFNEVREIADTLPFFQEYRFVLIEDSGLFKNANDFADYLPSMPESTVLAFAEKEVDKRSRLYKYVKKNGLAVEMKAMSAKDTKQFVTEKLKEAGREIRGSTAAYFLAQVDNSLLNLENEIEKLAAYTLGRGEVRREDIDAVCSVQVTGQIFQMLDAVAEGKKAQTVRLYHNLLSVRESPMAILYLLTRHFSILLQIKEIGQGISRAEIASKIKIPEFTVGKYQAQARHFSAARLQEMIESCVDAEYAFKRGRIQSQIGVEILLTEFVCAKE